MKVTKEQYEELKAMLSKVGVEIRIASYSGDTQLIGVQVKNSYRDNCILYSNTSGQEIKEMSKKEILDGHWSKN